MTTVEAPTREIEVKNHHQMAETAPAAEKSTMTCSSYKEAKYLAAARRLEGLNPHTYVVYDVALASWCVK
jgi:hypothetical protein